MGEHQITFAEVKDDGTVLVVRAIKQSALQACPHVLLFHGHYRDDDSCRCDDPTHIEMISRGYLWNGKAWV